MTSFNVNANLFRIAYACVSTEETRYYLNGVFVHPHPTEGVIMVSTDGHRMVVIHDPTGTIDMTGTDERFSDLVAWELSAKLCRNTNQISVQSIGNTGWTH